MVTATNQRPRRRTRLVTAGFVYLVVLLLVGLAAGGRPNNLLVWVFGFLLAGLLVSGLVSGFSMMALRIVRSEPRKGSVREPLVIRYEVENASRFVPAFDIRVEERAGGSSGGEPAFEQLGHAWVMHVGPRERVYGEAILRPLRRGVLRLGGFEASTTFPFGILLKRLAFTQPGEVLIQPETRELRRELLERVTAGGIGGHRLSRDSGGADDFFGVREYRAGDSVRSIAWKRLAGTGELATIERSRSVPPRLRILIDLRMPTEQIRVEDGEDARMLEERAIVLAASFAALAEQLGYEYALSVAGFEFPPIPLRRGFFHRERIMAVLAAIDLDAGRSPGNGLAASDERATVLAVHPDRVDLAIAPDAAWHFTARQFDGLVAVRAPSEEAAA